MAPKGLCSSQSDLPGQSLASLGSSLRSFPEQLACGAFAPALSRWERAAAEPGEGRRPQERRDRPVRGHWADSACSKVLLRALLLLLLREDWLRSLAVPDLALGRQLAVDRPSSKEPGLSASGRPERSRRAAEGDRALKNDMPSAAVCCASCLYFATAELKGASPASWERPRAGAAVGGLRHRGFVQRDAQ